MNLTLKVLTICLRLLVPGGHKKLVAENLALRQQLICYSRQTSKSPALKPTDRIIFSILAFFIPKSRLHKVAVLISPSTIIKFHRALVKKKYQILFGTKSKGKKGRKGFSKEIIDLILEIKTKNPSFGCPRIAMAVTNATGEPISEHTVRRLLKRHFRPRGDGPSWLSFIGSQKDSLWSLDFFRCESITLKSYWVMVVIDQFTREIVGLRTIRNNYDGPLVCCKFNQILGEIKRFPRYLSMDNDPVFQFDRWKINMEMLGINEIKSVPGVPTSHPFVERCIGTIRREFLDKTLFWTQSDLEQKLCQFQHYFNEARPHYSLRGKPPNKYPELKEGSACRKGGYQFARYCNGMFSIPLAA